MSSESRMSAIRALVRAVILCVTAFGLKLSPEQVAAVQLVAEGAMQVWAQFTTRRTP